MTTSEKKNTPTATAHQHRIRLFQPTRRPIEIKDKENKREILTSFARVRVSGKLGQQHADVLEAIMFKPLKRGSLDDGRIKLLVDPYVLRKITGMGGEQLEKTLTELMKVVLDVEIFSMNDDIRKGHLIDHVEDAKNSSGEKITRKNPLGGERVLWRVELGKTLTDLIDHDAWVTYDPSIIRNLRYGVSQAVLRHMLSHKNEPRGGWHIDTLIHAVCGDIASVAMRHRRSELKEDCENFQKCGVLVGGKKMRFL